MWTKKGDWRPVQQARNEDTVETCRPHMYWWITVQPIDPKPRSAGWNWRLELEWCERKILLGWLELVAGVVWEENTVGLKLVPLASPACIIRAESRVWRASVLRPVIRRYAVCGSLHCAAYIWSDLINHGHGCYAIYATHWQVWRGASSLLESCLLAPCPCWWRWRGRGQEFRSRLCRWGASS